MTIKFGQPPIFGYTHHSMIPCPYELKKTIRYYAVYPQPTIPHKPLRADELIVNTFEYKVKALEYDLCMEWSGGSGLLAGC
jgi:hypothetical protein